MAFLSRQKLARMVRAASWAALETTDGPRPLLHPPASIAWSFPSKAAAALQKRLQGTVVLPTDTEYVESRQGFVSSFQEFPQIIVYCKVFGDVSLCLDFARKFDLPVTCRSGGHSTAGYSVNSGMVIDLSHIDHVVIDGEARRAVVGAGANFGKLNAMLDLYRLHVPGGGCDDVCVGGYVQGGGYGFTSLMYGMNCDNAVEMLVALADGSIVAASTNTNADLFWALRGGTGNNFGVLLQVTYQLHPLWKVWGFGISWPLENAAAALAEMQSGFTGSRVPDNLGYQAILIYLKGAHQLLLRGMYKGSPKQGKAAIEPLLRTKGAQLDLHKTGAYSEMNDYLLNYPQPLPNVPPPVGTVAESRYVAKPCAESDWRTVTDYFRGTPNDGNFVGFEPYGRRIAEIDPHATAFIHRDVSFDVFSWVFWLNDKEREDSVAYLNRFDDVMGSLSNDQAYQNYPRRGNTEYRAMYWGKNFETLLAIKKKYDPKDVFAFQQGVSPPPDGKPLDPKLRGGRLFVDIAKDIDLRAPLRRPARVKVARSKSR